MALSISEFEIVLDEDSPSITIDPLKRKKSKSGSTKTSPQKKPRITTGVSNQESDFGNFDDGFFGSPSPATASQHDLGLNHYVSLISSSIVPLEENVWCIQQWKNALIINFDGRQYRCCCNSERSAFLDYSLLQGFSAFVLL